MYTRVFSSAQLYTLFLNKSTWTIRPWRMRPWTLTQGAAFPWMLRSVGDGQSVLEFFFKLNKTFLGTFCVLFMIILHWQQKFPDNYYKIPKIDIKLTKLHTGSNLTFIGIMFLLIGQHNWDPIGLSQAHFRCNAWCPIHTESHLSLKVWIRYHEKKCFKIGDGLSVREYRGMNAVIILGWGILS
jgi:hypothetical protein